MTRPKPSDWRKPHGNAAKGGVLLVLENGRDRPLSPAVSPEEPAAPARDASGRFLPGNPWGRMAKMRAGPTGVLAALEAQADPSWRAARRAGRRSAGHRIEELSKFFGGELSSAVCRLVQSECSGAADVEYIRARAAAENNPDLLRIAATLDASSRQAGRDAWELATREAEARTKVSQSVSRWIRPKPTEPPAESESKK